MERSYLKLLETAFLASGLDLFSKGKVRKRGSSPKLLLWNNALITATSLRSFAEARREGSWWGRLVENAVGAHLVNELQGPQWSVTYWRDGDLEVDFVVGHGASVWAIEVKSGRAGKQGGLEAFRKAYPKSKIWLLGPGCERSACGWTGMLPMSSMAAASACLARPCCSC